jgi:DNA repair exonuclease SbcCD ATPase subunit
MRALEAENLIEELLDLDHEKFTQAIFLHQDMVRKFVEGEPKDRSEIIDHLLGLKKLRELTEALNPKHRILNEIKVLQQTKERLEKQKNNIEIDTLEQLSQQKERIMKMGYQEELDIEYVNEKENSILSQINAFSKEYGLDLERARKPGPAGDCDWVYEITN